MRQHTEVRRNLTAWTYLSHGTIGEKRCELVTRFKEVKTLKGEIGLYEQITEGILIRVANKYLINPKLVHDAGLHNWKTKKSKRCFLVMKDHTSEDGLLKITIMEEKLVDLINQLPDVLCLEKFKLTKEHE